ncbi:MAG TPA: glycosyltransferase [Steroidobacteraceae bacterium]|nr:glycosyltransferase [Steroidobacteraceae bacterium]
MDHEPLSVVGGQIAILIPCRNEEASIAEVVRDFQRYLPAATVYVYDNGSDDETAQVARDAGARVFREPLVGKGNVVRRMFADIEADIYVMIDGDGTYDTSSAPRLIQYLVTNGLDIVNCARVSSDSAAYRPGHRLGNRMLTGLVARVFGKRLSDMLSGYRVLSRRFVKSFPALSTGFEIETELTVHALELRVPMAELSAPYVTRPRGSASKLRTVRDGLKILKLIVHLVKEERPLQFFSTGFCALAATSIALGIPVVTQYFVTGLVGRLPTAVLATGLMILAFLSLMCGVILDTVTRGRRELKRLLYLAAGREEKARESLAATQRRRNTP